MRLPDKEVQLRAWSQIMYYAKSYEISDILPFDLQKWQFHSF